jgi:restriction endonuclease S subunit
MRADWIETTLGEVADIQQGQNLAISTLTTGEYPVYGANGIVGHFDRWNVNQAVVALGCRGSCGTVHIVTGKAWLSNNVIAIWPKNKSQVVVAYIAFVLETADLRSSGVISGQVQPQITRTSLSPLGITLPPLSEQNRIVDVMAAVDTYIAALRRQAADARAARNAVLHEMLTVGGDDWTETTLGEAASINPPEAALNQNAPFIPMDAVQVGQRYAQYLEPRGERSGARAKGGDILFARITPCLENGKVAQVPPNVERCGGSTEFLVIRGSALTSPDFLYFWATWSETRVRAAGLMTGTTGRQRLSAGDFGALPLLLPPLSEQNRIVETVSAMDELIYATEQAIADAQRLRSGLLSSLLSGDHEIPESYDRLLGVA